MTHRIIINTTHAISPPPGQPSAGSVTYEVAYSPSHDGVSEAGITRRIAKIRKRMEKLAQEVVAAEVADESVD